jgi:hypothetical protein
VLLFETPETTLPRLDHNSTILPSTVATHVRPIYVSIGVDLKELWVNGIHSPRALRIPPEYTEHCQDDVYVGCEAMNVMLRESAKPWALDYIDVMLYADAKLHYSSFRG